MEYNRKKTVRTKLPGGNSHALVVQSSSTIAKVRNKRSGFTNQLNKY